jgi:hypothetical protein
LPDRAAGFRVFRKLAYLLFSHILGMFFAAVKFNITNDPVTICLFSTVCIMVIAQYLADLVHEL